MKTKKIFIMLALIIIFTALTVNTFPAIYFVFANIVATTQTLDNNNTSYKSVPIENNGDDFVIQNGVLINYTGNASYIKVPDHVTEIGPHAFRRVLSNSVEIYLPDHVEIISERAFLGYYTGKITGGNGVKEIGRRAFMYNSMEIPDFPNAEKIEAEAFYLSSVKNDNALRRFRAFAPEAFDGIVSGEEDFVIENNVLKEYKGTASIIKIPEGVKTVAAGVFRFAVSTDIYSPTEVYLPKSILKIGSRAFQYCGSLTKVVGLENVKEIGKRAFYLSGIQEANLRDVEIIDEEAFCYSELRKISGLGKLKKVEESGLSGCPLMDNIVLRRASPYRVVQKLPNGKENEFMIANGILFWAEDYCCGDLVIPNGVTDIATHFWGDITSVTIPDSVVKICDSAFRGSHKLQWVKMGDSVQEIGYQAFANCRNLTEVRLSNSVRELNQCFSGCTSLKSITLPASIEKISYDTFPEGITAVICPSGLTKFDFRSTDYENSPLFDSLPFGQGTFYVPEVEEDSFLAGYAAALRWEYLPIKLEVTELTLKVGEEYPLRFQGGAKATWKTSDKKVATVGSTGNIYAKKAGRVTITATIYGKEYQCRVTVK